MRPTTSLDSSMTETRRLQALREYRILDTDAEAAFDRLTRIAAAHYRAPIALVSLVDESRQWFKSRLGLDVCQTEREVSFCTHAIRSDEPFIIRDARKHPLFSDNPLVTGPPHIRFYAGCPLIAASGLRLGTLCIVDQEPRPDFDPGSIGVLQSLAAVVIDEMELRLARERAESESRAKSDFIATMSHELRTPMTSIIGYVELLAETGLDESQRDYVQLVQDSGAHLLELLNDALDLSRIEAGRLQLLPENFAPAELVDQAVQFFAGSARDRGLNLFVDDKPPPTTTIRSDRTRIRQVLFNLLNNAIKFTNEGDVVVSCNVEPDSNGLLSLHLTVRDTGIGIPEDIQAILFDRFVQGDGRETREHYGAGLGLAICREIVDALGGTISAENREEGGACFHAVIPATLAEER